MICFTFFKDHSGCCVGKQLKGAREAAEKLVRNLIEI